MKTYVLFIALCFFVVITSPARIKNGYGVDIGGAHESLRKIKLLMEGDLPMLQRASMKNKIADLINFITYHELTEKLLEQFRMISPDLFQEIDTLTDKKRRAIDVYVKFVTEKEMTAGVVGTTNLGQDKNDPDAYESEFGMHAVSVRVVIGKTSLSLLAHELGHVRYQVPNLAVYLPFYSKFYLANNYTAKSIGHNDNDLSGQQARNFSNRFRTDYLEFLRSGEKKLESYAALLQVIRRTLSEEIEI
jgi:hypothetical protein